MSVGTAFRQHLAHGWILQFAKSTSYPASSHAYALFDFGYGFVSLNIQRTLERKSQKRKMGNYLSKGGTWFFDRFHSFPSA